MLAIVSRGVLPQHACRSPISRKGAGASRAKIERANEIDWSEFRIADYGTRRRFSREWHDEVLRTLKRDIGHAFRGGRAT